MTTTCLWCAERIEQPDVGRPRQFCDDAERQRYARRKAEAPATWEEQIGGGVALALPRGYLGEPSPREDRLEKSHSEIQAEGLGESFNGTVCARRPFLYGISSPASPVAAGGARIPDGLLSRIAAQPVP
jgi:hypothetical protein